MKQALSKFIVLLILSLIFLVSCQSRVSVSPELNNNSIQFQDALQRTVVLSSPPERIVVAGKASFMILDAFYLFPGAGKKLIAYSGGGVNDPKAFLSIVDPELASKQVLEYQVGPEQVAGLKPDLVLMKSYLSGTDGASLEKLGIKVCYLDLETPETFLRDIGILGTILNMPDRARQIQNFYQSRLDSIQQKTQGLSRKPKVLLAQYSEKGGTGSLSVPPFSWIQTTMVSLSGGEPVWASGSQNTGWVVINLEQIFSWNPDLLILISYGQNSSAVANKLKNDSKWQELKAVKKNAVYGFPSDFFSWDMPDPRWILGLEWIAGRIHPEIFTYQMKDEVNQFYLELYRLSPEQVRELIFPKLKGDLD